MLLSNTSYAILAIINAINSIKSLTKIFLLKTIKKKSKLHSFIFYIKYGIYFTYLFINYKLINFCKRKDEIECEEFSTTLFWVLNILYNFFSV